MKQSNPCAMVFLVGTALLGASHLWAQGRGPSVQQVQKSGRKVHRTNDQALKIEEVVDEAARARKLAELRVWLGRLVGHFRVEGQVEQTLADPSTRQERQSVAVRGVADCAAIGAGPGVQCVIDATWPDIDMIYGEDRNGVRSSIPAWSNSFHTLHPAVFVYGIDTRYAGIHFFRLDNQGVGNGYIGTLNDDKVIFSMMRNCPVVQSSCTAYLSITAGKEGGVVRMVLFIPGGSVTLLLKREP